MMSLSEAVQGIGALMRGNDVRFTAVSTDSRKAATGDLFVALRGERFDGHDYINAARRQGAVAVMVDKAERAENCPALVVEDTRQGLVGLAGYWRSKFNLRLAAITGSNGKTTVKEMLAAILRKHAGADAVLATQGNLNNDIGVPLTLLRLRPPHRYAVVEMGMNRPGEIANLARIAKPDVALVNNAASAHLLGLGSVEAVARAKGEIFEGLSDNGVAVINADDAHADLWRQLCQGRRVLDFGFEHPAAINGRCKLKNDSSEIALQTDAGGICLKLQVPGLHNARNALAAAACARALGVQREAIAAGLAEFAGIKGRQQRKAGKNGAVVIDDSYNANPDSVKAAIDMLAGLSGIRVLVLGDMGELGKQAPQFHAQIGAQAKAAGIDRLYALGALSAEAAKQFGEGAGHFTQINDLISEVEKRMAPNVTVLVKGSRFMQMERVVERIVAGQEAAR
ncbi:MAG TPA: UDP-N-acetylmuramoyl-tripeptide--D-alanyl-D-alanine ligase [Burkholderiales bacterium]|nr:UDP-N-acetylmuramoyl-tripeptide--D-alanyl-D-alanine ligase [Burkholderiales bacterium]